MRCIYCGQVVVGERGMTVPGVGSAHRSCHTADLMLRRTFKDLELAGLTDEELQELEELLMQEKRARNRSDEEEDVELF